VNGIAVLTGIPDSGPGTYSVVGFYVGNANLLASDNSISPLTLLVI
jgi:hypothetical protein